MKRRTKPPVCPRCGKPATLAPGRYGTKATCCGLWSWDLKPLVTRDTHAARIQAHAAFDVLWKQDGVPRGEAYARLQVAMGMSRATCHIGLMSETEARRVVEIVGSGVLRDAAP